MNIFVWILGFQKKELGGNDIRDIVINRRPKENNIILQETRIDIVRPLASISLLDYHGY
jgi:hypothetical protein